MRNPNIYYVTKTEAHALSHCPCDACNRERARRATEAVSHGDPRVTHLQVRHAFIMGMFTGSRLSRTGSKARDMGCPVATPCNGN